jgi:hypothetical protein
LEVTNCDLKFWNSAFVSSNIQSLCGMPIHYVAVEKWGQSCFYALFVYWFYPPPAYKGLIPRPLGRLKIFRWIPPLAGQLQLTLPHVFYQPNCYQSPNTWDLLAPAARS